MRVLMCAPSYIRIEHEINAHMKKDNPPIVETALGHWKKLLSIYNDYGITSWLIRPDSSCQDMCFTANAGWYYKDKILLSRFTGKISDARTGEIPSYVKMFAKYKNLLPDTTVIIFPFQGKEGGCVSFEGQGDIVVVDATGNSNTPYILMGYGQGRTDYEAAEILRGIYDIPSYKMLPLRLAKETFYHLDTACVFIPPYTLMYYPPAFDKDSQRMIEALPVSKIRVKKYDADNFVCNGVTIPTDTETIYITSKTSKNLVQELAQRNIRVVELDTTEFLKNGGSVRCLTFVLPEGQEINTKEILL